MDKESYIPLVPPTIESPKPGETDSGPPERGPKGVSLPAYDEMTPLVDGAAPLQNGAPEPKTEVGVPMVPESSEQGSTGLPYPEETVPTAPHPVPSLPYPTDQTQSSFQGQSSDLPYPSEREVPPEAPSVPAEHSSGGLPYPPATTAPDVTNTTPYPPVPPADVEAPSTDNPYPPDIVGDQQSVPEEQPSAPSENDNDPKPEDGTGYTIDETRLRRIGRQSFRESFRQVRGLLKLPSYRGGRNYFPAEPPPAYEDVNPVPLPETISPRQPEAAPEPSVIPPTTEIQASAFGESPIFTTCPGCGERIRTVVSFVPGVLTYLFCCIFFMIGWWFMCCLLPFCVPGFKDVHHMCPHCKRTIGKYDRLGGN